MPHFSSPYVDSSSELGCLSPLKKVYGYASLSPYFTKPADAVSDVVIAILIFARDCRCGMGPSRGMDSHAGLPAFRGGGGKFASLASQAGGYRNLMLALEQQAAFVDEAPEIFLPIPGGWGKMGHTHIRLAAASEDVLTDALRMAHDPLSTDNDRHVRTEPNSCHSLLPQVA
jgi:hypothetical protein